MPQVSTATSHWKGSTVGGGGTVSTASPAISKAPLTWRARTGNEAGTTPEELLAAGWAGCYAMAFSFALTSAGHEPASVDVQVSITFGPNDAGFGVLGAVIHVDADVPGIDPQLYESLAQGAKKTCPVSVAFAGTITPELQLQVRA